MTGIGEFSIAVIIVNMASRLPPGVESTRITAEQRSEDAVIRASEKASAWALDIVPVSPNVRTFSPAD
jgi:hypothetical protein